MHTTYKIAKIMLCCGCGGDVQQRSSGARPCELEPKQGVVMRLSSEFFDCLSTKKAEGVTIAGVPRQQSEQGGRAQTTSRHDLVSGCPSVSVKLTRVSTHVQLHRLMGITHPHARTRAFTHPCTTSHATICARPKVGVQLSHGCV
jgi:hypothetical protein